VLEALKEVKTVAQIASENGVHPNQIHHWKKQALGNFSQLFEGGRQAERQRAAEHEQQLHGLYAEIG
jgi:transposase-like protein